MGPQKHKFDTGDWIHENKKVIKAAIYLYTALLNKKYIYSLSEKWT